MMINCYWCGDMTRNQGRNLHAYYDQKITERKDRVKNLLRREKSPPHAIVTKVGKDSMFQVKDIPINRQVLKNQIEAGLVEIDNEELHYEISGHEVENNVIEVELKKEEEVIKSSFKKRGGPSSRKPKKKKSVKKPVIVEEDLEDIVLPDDIEDDLLDIDSSTESE